MFGIGDMIGAVAQGQVVDRLGSRIGCVVNVLTIIIASGVSFIQIHDDNYNWITFLMTFAWGFCDGCVNVHSNQMMGFEFATSSDPYSIFNTVQSVAIVSFNLFQGAVVNTENTRSLELYTLGIMIIGCLTCGITFFFKFKKFDKVVAK